MYQRNFKRTSSVKNLTKRTMKKKVKKLKRRSSTLRRVKKLSVSPRNKRRNMKKVSSSKNLKISLFDQYIDENKPRLFPTLCGQCVPPEVVEQILDFIPDDLEKLNGVGLASKEMSILTLKSWKAIELSNTTGLRAPLLAIQCAKKVTVDPSGLKKKELKKIAANIDPTELFFSHVMESDKNDFFAAVPENKVYRNCELLSVGNLHDLKISRKNFPHLKTLKFSACEKPQDIFESLDLDLDLDLDDLDLDFLVQDGKKSPSDDDMPMKVKKNLTLEIVGLEPETLELVKSVNKVVCGKDVKNLPAFVNSLPIEALTVRSMKNTDELASGINSLSNLESLCLRYGAADTAAFHESVKGIASESLKNVRMEMVVNKTFFENARELAKKFRWVGEKEFEKVELKLKYCFMAEIMEKSSFDIPKWEKKVIVKRTLKRFNKILAVAFRGYKIDCRTDDDVVLVEMLK